MAYIVYTVLVGHRKSVKSQSQVFVSKPFTGRYDKLVRHEDSKAHVQAADDFREAEVRKASHSTVVDVVRQIPVVTEDGEAFKDLLRLMYFLNKNEIPHTTNLGFLRELCILVGNTTLPKLDKSKRTNYGSEQTMEELVRAIGVTLEEDILNEVRLSAYYGIIIDEETDISLSKQLGICVSYINSSGSVTVRNLKILEVTQGTADVLTDAIVNYVTHTAPVPLLLTKFAGGSSDGASVMSGTHSGVVTRLKQLVPTFIATHCVAHRLALAASQATNASPSIAQFERVITQIFSFFSRSTVRLSALKEMEKIFNEPQIKLQRPTDIRWLSYQNAVDSLRKCLAAVVATLEKEACEGDATACGLVNEIRKPQFIGTLLLLSDVLAILGNLSRTFQLASLNLLHVEGLLSDAKAGLQHIIDNPFESGHMLQLTAKLGELQITSPFNRDMFKQQAVLYINTIISNLDNRFPQVRTLTLLGYLDPRNVSDATPLALKELGDLMQVDGNQLWQEYTVYKSFVKNLPELSIIAAVKAMHSFSSRETMKVAFPILFDLLAKVAVLPASSAQVERMFSSMKRVKDARRSRLKASTLDNLIRISSEGPSLEQWDPTPAMIKWESWGNR